MGNPLKSVNYSALLRRKFNHFFFRLIIQLVLISWINNTNWKKLQSTLCGWSINYYLKLCPLYLVLMAWGNESRILEFSEFFLGKLVLGPLEQWIVTMNSYIKELFVGTKIFSLLHWTTWSQFHRTNNSTLNKRII